MRIIIQANDFEREDAEGLESMIHQEFDDTVDVSIVSKI